MQRMRILLLAAAGAVAVLVVALVLVRNGDDEAARNTTGEEPRAAPRETGASETGARSTQRGQTQPESTLPAPKSTVIRIAVRRGLGSEVGKTERLLAGRPMTLIVTADVRDVVRLRGYDRSAPVAPGSPARISFRAVRPGRFAVVLVNRKRQIGQLVITP